MKGLIHSNIVKFFESFKDEDTLCIVMEYMSGGDLRQVLKRGKLTERQIVKILEQALQAFVIITAQRHLPQRHQAREHFP